MTDADKIMHPKHFGTDLTDIRIQINHLCIISAMFGSSANLNMLMDVFIDNVVTAKSLWKSTSLFPLVTKI